MPQTPTLSPISAPIYGPLPGMETLSLNTADEKSLEIALSTEAHSASLTAGRTESMEAISAFDQNQEPPQLLETGHDDEYEIITEEEIEIAKLHDEESKITNLQRFTDPAAAVAKQQKLMTDIFLMENKELIEKLKSLRPDSIANEKKVIEKLLEHRKITGTSTNEKEISDYVRVGEGILTALNRNQTSPSNANKINGISPFDADKIPRNKYTLTAVCWYAMASAATQDLYRQHVAGDSSLSDMVTSGSLRMADPDNKIYNFLRGDHANVNPRVSTHFEKEVDHNEKFHHLYFINLGKPTQWGLEDYESKLPGLGGALLFDKISSNVISEDGSIEKQEELFMKFESTGSPPWINTESKDWVASFGAGMARTTLHAIEYAITRFVNNHSSEDIVRQEHLHKGHLKYIYKELTNFFKDAGSDPYITDQAMRNYGLVGAKAEISKIYDVALKQGDKELIKKTKQISALIAREEEKLNLGEPSSIKGERRGAEVRVSMNPDIVASHLEEARKSMPAQDSSAATSPVSNPESPDPATDSASAFSWLPGINWFSQG